MQISLKQIFPPKLSWASVFPSSLKRGLTNQPMKQ